MGRKTISPTGDEGGFTLLEILLALAVIGLIATVLIGGSARLLETKPLSPDQVFWSAVLEARKEALKGNTTVRLSFDDKAKAFLVDNGGAAPKSIPLAASPLDVQMIFLAGEATATNLMPGTEVSNPLAAVEFYGDGTCTPFRMQIKTPVGTRMIGIDPWTCAAMLAPLNPDGSLATAH